MDSIITSKKYLVSSSGRRVMRSEVWNNFELCGLTAVCRVCKERLKVGPTRQTSSLWRHWKRHTHSHKMRNVATSENIKAENDLEEVDSSNILPKGHSPTFCQSFSPNFDNSNLSNYNLSTNGFYPSRVKSEPIQNGICSPYSSILHQQSPKWINPRKEMQDKMITEFLLQNGISPFTHIITSPTFAQLISLGPHSSDNLEIPTPMQIINEVVPKIHTELMHTIKGSLCNNFFTLVLDKIHTTQANKCVIRVSAAKLDDSFQFSNETISIFLSQNSNDFLQDLQKVLMCTLQVENWQICAVVHDGSIEMESVSERLGFPGIPSLISILEDKFKKIGLRSDSHQLEMFQKIKEQFIGDDCSLPDSMMQLDQLFKTTENERIKQTDNEILNESWNNILSEIIDETYAQFGFFLSPKFCFKNPIYSEEKWTKIASQIVEELLNSPQFAILDLDGFSEDDQHNRLQIETEVSNYINSLFDDEHASNGLDIDNNSFVWWCKNSYKFPRLSQLARQYLPIPSNHRTCGKIQNCSIVKYATKLGNGEISMADNIISQFLLLQDVLIVKQNDSSHQK